MIAKGIFPLRWSKPSASVKGTHEMCRVVVDKLLKIFYVGFFGMCYTAYCKIGVIKAFYHP